MNKNIAIAIAVLVLIVVGGAVYFSSSENKEVMMENKMDESANMTDKEMMKDDTAMQDDADMMDAEDKMMKSGSYEAYSPEKLSRAEDGDVVLFFHASWCPSCRGLNSDIEKNLSAIPTGVSILKLDYDKETELKKKYGVTYQHTLVQVSADGTMIKKWSGSPSLGTLVSQIN